MYPFENYLSSFLLKTFRCKCAKVYLYFEEVRKKQKTEVISSCQTDISLRLLIAKENICLFIVDMENRVEFHGDKFKI